MMHAARSTITNLMFRNVFRCKNRTFVNRELHSEYNCTASVKTSMKVYHIKLKTKNLHV